MSAKHAVGGLSVNESEIEMKQLSATERILGRRLSAKVEPPEQRVSIEIHELNSRNLPKEEYDKSLEDLRDKQAFRLLSSTQSAASVFGSFDSGKSRTFDVETRVD